MPLKRKLFTEKNVVDLRYKRDNTNHKILIGRGQLESDVHLGQIKFKDKNGKIIRKQVVIKDFRSKKPKYGESFLGLQKVINDLKNIKLSNGNYLLPKMGILKIKDATGEERYVQVTEAFVKGKKSKLLGNKEVNHDLGTIKDNLEAFARLSNKGYVMFHAPESFMAGFKNHPGNKLTDLESLPILFLEKDRTKAMELLARQTLSEAMDYTELEIERIAKNKIKKEISVQEILNQLINHTYKYIDKDLKQEYLNQVKAIKDRFKIK